MDERTIRVLIADDQPHYADLFAERLERQGGVEIVGLAETAEQAVRLAGSLRPDAVLLDLGMKEMGSLEACKRMLEENPQLAVVIVTVDNSSQSFEACVSAGARGYVVKQDRHDPARVVDALRLAVQRESLDADLQAELRKVASSLAPDALVTAGVTPREREVFALVVQGRSNKQIAASLGMNVRTVEKYVSKLLRKLGAENRTQLASFVHRRTTS